MAKTKLFHYASNMYAAYLDESFDNGNQGFFAVAAVFGDSWKVMKGEYLWRGLLDKYGFKTYKSSRLRRRPDVNGEFAAAFCDSGLIACGTIAKQAEVISGLRGSALHYQYSQSPYMLLYQQTFINVALDLREANSPDPVHFVCDANARYSPLLDLSFKKLKKLNSSAAPFMASCSFDDDVSCFPLQMADFIAGEIRLQGEDWTDTANITPALRMLIDRKVLWSVKNFDNKCVEFTRGLVDGRSGM